MKKWIWMMMLPILLMSISGCHLIRQLGEEDDNDFEKTDSGLKDNENWYTLKQDEVLHFYVTVLEKQSEKKGKKWVFADVNQDIDYNDSDKAEVDVLLEMGTEEGPQKGNFGYGLVGSNGTLRIRGHSTRWADQKSYKIVLNQKVGLWENQKVLNLNKHPYDATRVRNRTCFELLKKVPGVSSLRTQFVVLHLKDLTGESEENFVDYGLYTMVENYDDYFLQNHKLDIEGDLYKAENFEFLRYPEQIRAKDDPEYKKKNFEKVLEIRNASDHKELISMLDDVNDDTLSIDQVMAKHFDRENYISWLATNILLENADTNAQNFYLYRPSQSSKWYFMPWDYDGSLGFYDTPGNHVHRSPWMQAPASNYWAVPLHRKFLKNGENREALLERMELILKEMGPEHLEKVMTQYFSQIEMYLGQVPDKDFHMFGSENLQQLVREDINRISQTPTQRLEQYKESLQLPMPFFLGEVEKEAEKVEFIWGSAYDFNGESITYTFTLAKDPDLKDVIIKKEGLSGTELEVSNVDLGTYYWSVEARNSKNKTMLAFDEFETEDGIVHAGVKQWVNQ